MMLVKREVFRTMMKKFPERKYQSDQIINGQVTLVLIIAMIYSVQVFMKQSQARKDTYRKTITFLDYG
jgi:hypothetical protein